MNNIERAKARLILDHYLYAGFLLQSELTATDTVPTLAVDARGRIYYNPAFTDSLNVAQCVWALAHEVLHVMLQHANRIGARSHKRWNIAGDAVINDMLAADKVGQPIPKTVNMPGSKDKTTEQVYSELPESDGDGGGGGGGNSQGQQGGSSDDPMDGDVIPGDDLSESERSQIAAEVKVKISQAAQVARMRGKLTANQSRFVDGILQVKTPWYEILERFMTGRIQNDYSWKKPNRRFVGQGVYLPSLDTDPTMGEVVIVVDTSGSITNHEIGMFTGHVNRIMETCKPEKIHVLYADAAVCGVDEYTQEDLPIRFKNLKGGGGTAFAPAFDWVEDNRIDPECLIYLTDMYGSFPQSAPDYPVVWLSITDQVAPFGETVRFEE